MLRALFEAGITPDLVVGTSVGALNGAVVAARGKSAAQGKKATDQLTDVWLAMDRTTVFGGSRRRAALTFLRSRGEYFSDPGGLRRLIDLHCPVPTIEELTLPFAAVVTDVLSGEPCLIDSGPLAPALLASAAIPGVYPGVQLGGRHYVDGGVVANLPVKPTFQQGARTVVVLDATPNQLSRRPPDRPIRRMLHTGGLMLRSQAAASLDGLSPDRLVVDIPRATPDGYGSFNFAGTEKLIARGYEAAMDRLAAA